MRNRIRFAGIAAFAAVVTCWAAWTDGASAAPPRAQRPVRATAVFPHSAGYTPRGSIQVVRWPATRRRAERTRILLRFTRLRAGETYSLYGDDPQEELLRLGMFEPYRIVPRNRRPVVVRYDSGQDAFPFDSTPEELAGHIVQLRNEAGEVVLAGAFPALPPFQARR